LREEFLRLLDAGVSLRVAAGQLGLGRRAYRWAGEIGRVGRRTPVTAELAQFVRETFLVEGTIAAAARAAGLSGAPTRRILVAAGLVSATPRPMRKTAQRRAARVPVMNHASMPEGSRLLTLQDRIKIADGLLVGWSQRRIAADLGRPTSTVTREVENNSTAGVYLPYQADAAAAATRARPKPSKLATEPRLRAEVEDGLRRKLSPEQISHRLRVDFPDDESMWVSTETIYQALYFQARGGLKKEVQTALRTGRTRRKPHRDPQQRTQRFTDPMVMISDRPAEVADRAVPGHWEGDLIMGEGNRTAIGTLVERATRYTLLVHLPDGHNAEQVRDGLVVTMQTLPEHLRGSLTWDQGSEMARHLQFQIATDINVFFCDPASPWQRGTNENTNGLLRQYFPKGSDLSRFNAADLEYVAQELNGRPRKTLGWATPAERLRDLLTI
jgi:IS30 family transposase